MIDILEIRGKKVVIIDELSFGFPLDMREAHQDDEVHPGFQIQINSSSFKKPEKLGERMAY